MQTGDYLVHNSGKVCQITGTEIMKLTGKDVRYLILTPIRGSAETIYVPEEVASATLKPIMSREEAMNLIHRMDEIEPLKIRNERHRDQEYAAAYDTQDMDTMVSVVKELHNRQEHRRSIGKTLPSRDAQMMARVQSTIDECMAVALGIRPEEVSDFIRDNR